MRRTAFTLLELLLVLAIIIAIAGMGVMGYQRQYARSQFKSGVIQLQVDLTCARVLAMQSGNAYVFRYVPGSNVYEIAPLKTLQETLYRVNGDLAQADGYDSLGGSLTTSVGPTPSLGVSALGANPLGMDLLGANSLNMGAGTTSIGFDTSALGALTGTDPAAAMMGAMMGVNMGSGAATAYTDDLFSPENIAADMAEAMKANERDARLGATNVDLTGGLGGSLNSIAGVPALASNNMTPGLGGSALGGTALGGAAMMNGAATSGVASPYGYATDYSGMGGEFGLDATGMTTGQVPSAIQTLRDLNGTEKLLADEHTLMSRVNLDGLIIRKQIAGDVVFTFMRVSDSTSSPLRARRPGAAKNDSASPITGASEGEDLGSALGGSLRSIPVASNNDALGGALSAIPGTDPTGMTDAESYEEDPLATSMWSEPLVFFPNGKTSSAVLGFASMNEYSFYSEISLRGMTGVSRISAISAVPPEYDPASTALTQEQLFRLYNPGVAYSGNDPANASATGGALNSTTPNAALGVDAPDVATTSGSLDTLGGLGASDLSAPSVNYGRAGGGGYGSTERRSGYSFNATGGRNGGAQGMPDAGGLGVANGGMDQGALGGMNNANGALGGMNDPTGGMNNATAGGGLGGLGGANNGALGGNDDPFGAVDAAMGGLGNDGGGLGGNANNAGGALGGGENDRNDRNEQDIMGGGL